MAYVISEKIAKQTMNVVNKLIAKGYKTSGAPSVFPKAAELLEMSRAGVESRVRTAQRVYGLALSEPAEVVEDINVSDSPSVEELSMRDRQRYNDTIDRLRGELRTAHRTINKGETLRQALFGLKDAEIKPPKWVLSTSSNNVQEIPVLFTSDQHFGEVIRKDQVNGINEYNIDIALRRYKTVIERTIKVCKRHGAKYPGFIYVRGGDGISGNIHMELQKTNELTSLNQCIALVEAETAGINALVKEFGRVFIISVCGNHGRIGEKVEFKNYVDDSYDYVTAYMLEQKFAGNKNVVFYTPKSPDALINIYGWNIVFTHGNQLSGKGGGTGFIGPAATIQKGVYKLRQAYSQVGIYVDTVVLGHYHTALLGGSHYIANTSLCGYGEFAQSLRCEPEAPGQILFFVDNKIGVGQRSIIYAEDPIKHTSPQAVSLESFK